MNDETTHVNIMLRNGQHHHSIPDLATRIANAKQRLEQIRQGNGPGKAIKLADAQASLARLVRQYVSRKESTRPAHMRHKITARSEPWET